MNHLNLLNWMLLGTALLGRWWGYYRLALRPERSFAYNRAFLVLGPLLAAGLPLLPLAWPAGWAFGPVALPEVATVLLPAVRVGAGSASGTSAIDWAVWLWLVYLGGALLMLARLAGGIVRLWWSTRRLPRTAGAGYTLMETHGRLPTSSFGRVVFWDETLPLSAAEARQVLRHELAHVRQGHTYDRLLLELLRAGLWFNPFVHLGGRALALTHEFLADEAALRPDAVSPPVPAASYTHLLARQVASRLGFSVPLAHSFSHSQTLRRIAMIQRTNPIRRWKQWLALPLLGALLFTVASAQTPAPAPPTSPARSQTPDGPPPGKVYTYVEQMPSLPGGGGSAAIVTAIQAHLAYPRVAAASRKNGRVFVSFVVTSQGAVEAVKILKGLSPDYDAAVVAAVRQLPTFLPGRQGGKPINVSYTVPVQFAWAATNKTR